MNSNIKASEDYFIPRDEAAAIISSVKGTLKDWQKAEQWWIAVGLSFGVLALSELFKGIGKISRN